MEILAQRETKQIYLPSIAASREERISAWQLDVREPEKFKNVARQNGPALNPDCFVPVSAVCNSSGRHSLLFDAGDFSQVSGSSGTSAVLLLWHVWSLELWHELVPNKCFLQNPLRASQQPAGELLPPRAAADASLERRLPGRRRQRSSISDADTRIRTRTRTSVVHTHTHTRHIHI